MKFSKYQVGKTFFLLSRKKSDLNTGDRKSNTENVRKKNLNIVYFCIAQLQLYLVINCIKKKKKAFIITINTPIRMV